MTRRPLCLVCLIFMMCMCLGDLAGMSLIRGNPLPEQVQEYISTHPDAVIVGEVQRCQATDVSFSVYLKQVSLICRSEKIPIENVRVFLKKKEEISAGSLISVSGKLEQTEPPRNPGEFDSRQYYACEHIYYFMKQGVIRKKSTGSFGYQQMLLNLKDRIRAVLRKCAGRDSPVFEAMLLGEKSDLEEARKLRYQMAGMIHILAISGLHISILGMGIFSLLKKTGFGNGTAGVFVLFLMLQYGILTGGSVSAMRAVCMFVISVGAKILGRSYDLLTALALSAILLLLDSPAYLYSSSFLLSFGAVVGIGAVTPWMIKITGIRGKTGKSLISSLAVQLAMLPVMLRFFGEVSVVGIFLNLAILPTVGGVLLSGLCCCMLGLWNSRLGILAAAPGRTLLWGYEKLCILAGKLPFCTWIGGKPEIWKCILYYFLLAAGILSGLYAAERLRNREEKERFRRLIKGSLSFGLCSLFAFSGILLLSWKSRDSLRITCLDIGQGDGIVLEMPQEGVFLMDCGSSNKNNIAMYQLLPYLKSRGISYIDGILISHTDQDHISGILELLEYMSRGLTAIRAGVLLLPDWSRPPEIYQELCSLAEAAGVKVDFIGKGDCFSSGKVKFRILAPLEASAGENVNEEGMVMELEYGEFQGLFTGDIGSDTEKKLLPVLRDVDFLKTAHHGSRYSTCQEFLDRVKPELAVISCSASNTYGHPSPETTLRMKKSGVKVEFTMKNGAVTVSADGKYISTERFVEEL